MIDSNTLSLPAPAKLNLFLNVLDHREDGYHNLQTVFQFIDLSDQLEFSLKENESITLDTPGLTISQEDNLIYRAAKLLQKTTGSRLGAHIRLDKNLPIGGGVGGGSSNAATTLVGLNRLWQTGLSKQELMKLGSQLGADVPIFIHGEAAYATGTGDVLTNLELDEPWYVILIPPVSVPTAEIFSHPQLTRNNQPITISEFLSHGGSNSMEGLVRSLYPDIDRALDWLNQFGFAKMSGSGSTVFLSFEEKNRAESVVSQIPAPFKGVVAKGCNKSLLYR
ncbi:MAG: 4-(cytidine 5'-diphospho)-2-C-methyl-D-erythritol kinase [Gammaproteobacteria bacterium]|nr:4-(cytidine 5'-diphospho)-2-C-methyl-D-erythritol kinase [Gammaproteobacteria bacterium]